MVGVAGGGVGFWPDTKSGCVCTTTVLLKQWGGGGGGGGCCRFMARYEEHGCII